MNYCYDILCSVDSDKVLSEKQENIEELKVKVKELKMKLEDETKMSKAKTRDIEQLTRQKKGKL